MARAVFVLIEAIEDGIGQVEEVPAKPKCRCWHSGRSQGSALSDNGLQ